MNHHTMVFVSCLAWVSLDFNASAHLFWTTFFPNLSDISVVVLHYVHRCQTSTPAFISGPFTLHLLWFRTRVLRTVQCSSQDTNIQSTAALEKATFLLLGPEMESYAFGP
eukprot:m.46178 g.46178  ORF g.46178 m.46178 type:complete len:110 (+) comp10911_c0_seq4:1580-1909(+)